MMHGQKKFKSLHCDLDVYILTVCVPVIITNTTTIILETFTFFYTVHFCLEQT
jgi:hypothetical protein